MTGMWYVKGIFFKIHNNESWVMKHCAGNLFSNDLGKNIFVLNSQFSGNLKLFKNQKIHIKHNIKVIDYIFHESWSGVVYSF